MFTNFLQNIYPLFIEEDFELLSEDEEFNIFSEDIDMIRFAKRENTMFYIVNVWNMEKVDLDSLHLEIMPIKNLNRFLSNLIAVI